MTSAVMQNSRCLRTNVETIGQYQIEDPENGTITWSLSGPDADTFQIDEQGNLSPVVALDFESPASSDDSNVHTLTVTATDDGSPSCPPSWTSRLR